ncbi:MAG: Hsp20 family protein [Actinobacteria bacterium]|nr:Hsp20 family protein [Actinomycetota bacterium]
MTFLVPRRVGMFEDTPGELFNMLEDFFAGIPKAEEGDIFKADVEEAEKEYVIKADLPGVKKEEIDIEIDEGKLVINVKHEEEETEEKKNYIHRERRLRSMSRGVYLDKAAAEGVTAKLEEGVLTVVVPKKEEAPPTQKIAIE